MSLISWGSSKSSSSSSSTSSSLGSSFTSISSSSASSSSVSGSSSDSCPDICIRANGENHYLTGTFLTNAEEDTEKCGYILSVGGLDYSIFVMGGGGVEVGPNNNDPSTFYPDFDTFISDNSYGFSECTSSSSSSSDSSSSGSSISQSSSLSSTSTSSSSFASSSSASSSYGSSSDSSGSNSEPTCEDFCLTWTDNSTGIPDYGTLELSGVWFAAGDPFLDGVPDLPTTITNGNTPYAGYCYMLASGTPDGNLAWYQGYVDKGGGVIEPIDYPHLYHDDAYIGTFQDFQAVLLPVAEYKIASGPCPSSTSSQSSSGSSISYNECGTYCMKATTASQDVTFHEADGFFEIADLTNEPATYRDDDQSSTSEVGDIIGSCVHTFLDVDGNGASWSLWQPIKITPSGTVFKSDHVHFYDQFGDLVQTTIEPTTSVIFTIASIEYEFYAGNCPSTSSSSSNVDSSGSSYSLSSTSSDFSSASSLGCGDLCVSWFVRDETEPEPVYDSYSETFMGISGTYTDFLGEEQPTCIYTGFAGMGVVNGGDGFAYDIRKDQFGNYRMFNLSNNTQSNRGGQDGNVLDQYQIDAQLYFIEHGACTSTSSSTYIPQEILAPTVICVTTTNLSNNYVPPESGGEIGLTVPLQTINSTKSINQAQNWAEDGPGEGPYINPDHIPQQVLDFWDNNPDLELAAYYRGGTNLESDFAPRGHFIYMFTTAGVYTEINTGLRNPIFHYRPEFYGAATDAELSESQVFIRFFNSAQHWHTVFETIVCIHPTYKRWLEGEQVYECVGQSFDCLGHRCKMTGARKDFIMNYQMFTPNMKQAQTIDDSDSGSYGYAYWRYTVEDEEYATYTFWHQGNLLGNPAVIYCGDEYSDYAEKYCGRSHGMSSGWHYFMDIEDSPGQLYELWWVWWPRNENGVPYRLAQPGDPEYNELLPLDEQTNKHLYPSCRESCAPREIVVTFPTTYNFLATVEYFTVTVLYCKGRYYYEQADPDDYDYFNRNQNIFKLEYFPATGVGTPQQESGYWAVRYGNLYFAYFDNTPPEQYDGPATHPSADPCDPTGTWQISNSIYYDGYYITIVDANPPDPVEG